MLSDGSIMTSYVRTCSGDFQVNESFLLSHQFEELPKATTLDTQIENE